MFRELLEAAPDSMVVVNQQGIILNLNSQTLSLFGYERTDLIGQRIEVLMPDRFRQGHRGHLVNYLATPRLRPMGAGLELAGRHKDGHEFPVEISLSPVETAQGLQVIAAIRDITDRKRADEERAAQRTAEGEAAVKELESPSATRSHTTCAHRCEPFRVSRRHWSRTTSSTGWGRPGSTWSTSSGRPGT